MTLIYFCISAIIFLAVYWSIPAKHRAKLILLSNIAFLLYFGVWFFFLQFASSVLHFFSGVQIYKNRSRRKIWIGLCILVDVGLCVFAKSRVFNGANHLLPIGISFNALTNLGYVLSIDRGVAQAVGFLDFYLFSAFFSCLLMGPIEKIQNLLPQMKSERKFERRDLGEGLFLISLGLFKKFVVADRLSGLNLNQNKFFKTYTAYELWIFFVLCLFEIFCDFSAYIDIVRGFSKMMGIHVAENFNRPYVAKSIPDIWSRWNITLVNWMREYLYYPALLKTKNIYLATFLVMVIMGLWHEPSLLLILWGLYWSFLYSVHIQLRTKGITLIRNHFVSSILMILAMGFSTVFFISATLSELTNFCLRAFAFNSEIWHSSFRNQFGALGLSYLVAAAIVIYSVESFRKNSLLTYFALAFFLGVLTILMGVSDSQVFLYMRY